MKWKEANEDEEAEAEDEEAEAEDEEAEAEDEEAEAEDEKDDSRHGDARGNKNSGEGLEDNKKDNEYYSSDDGGQNHGNSDIKLTLIRHYLKQHLP